MRKTVLFLLTFASFFNAKAQYTEPAYKNTIKVESTDSYEQISTKAVHVIPSEKQLHALKNEFIAFIHFGPNSFTRMEWGSGKENPKTFALKTLDTDQWCETMKAAGMKKVIFTAKHHDGFCLWQTRYTRHGIMSTDFRNGKGDVLKDLSASCQKYGLELGIYLSPADLYQIENPEGLYGNLSKATKKVIPRPVPGRPFQNKKTFEFEVDDYNEYFLNQLFELLTEYGPIHEVWLDGAHPKRKGGQTYNYIAWKKLIHTLAPEAVIFGREDIRWCGNEGGGTRATEWNVIPYQDDPDKMSRFKDITGSDVASCEKLYQANFLHYQPAETNTSIREGWFYRDDVHQKVRSADDVFDIYERSVGGNSIFLLNIPPNREGMFSAADVAALKETGKRIRETYGTNLLADAKGPEALVDNNYQTALEIKPHMEIVISTANPITTNRFVLQEAIATHSERVKKHALDAWVDGAWKQVAQSTNIGYKRILRFPEVTSSKFRIRILDVRATPALCAVSAHYYKVRPPQLTCFRQSSGELVIAPREKDFKWNSHGENAAENLSAGYKIYYTTDGSEPDTSSKLYTGPFEGELMHLKAIAVLHGLKGTVLNEHIGMFKQSWKVLPSDGSSLLAVDLGRKAMLSGIAYLPSMNQVESKITGKIEISQDAKKWQVLEEFDFGNLKNDPSKRLHFFKNEVKTRYIRISVKKETGNTGSTGKIDLKNVEVF